MISRILYTLERGVAQLRANTKLLFIAAILFVFPLLVVLVIQQFNSAATANIQTVQQQSTAALHEVIATQIGTDHAALSLAFSAITQESSELSLLRLYRESEAGVVEVVASNSLDDLSSTSTLSTVLQLGKVEPNQTFTVPLTNAGIEIEQSVRYLSLDAGNYYIFSEYDRSQTNAVLQKRKQDSYLLLTLLFTFLIALAYWINRQSDWQTRHEKLAQILQERDLFSNMIAHEFRTPLTAIKGYASFLQESKTLSPEESRFVDTIRDSAERLVLLVNDFLEIARIQSGKMKIEKRPTNIRDSISGVINTLQEEATAKSLQLVYTPALKPQVLNTDENRLVQVLTNIVSNSIKYTDTGTVEVSCESKRSGLVIRIKDTGMGISASDQKLLFSPFARVGGVEKTTTTGTGLGMWITKQLVELLGGSIAVESIKGVGTHVVIEFAHTDT